MLGSSITVWQRLLTSLGVSKVFLTEDFSPEISGLGGYDPERGAKVAGDVTFHGEGGWGWIKLTIFCRKEHEDIYQMIRMVILIFVHWIFDEIWL